MIRSSLTDHGATPPRSNVHWVASATRPDEVAISRGTHPGAARLGAAVAVAICLMIAAFEWLRVLPTGWIVGAIGLPGTTVLAWRMAPRVIAATRGGAVAVAVGLAVGTILVTDAFVVAGIFVAAGLDAAGSMAPSGPAISAVDLVAGIVGAASMGIFLFVIGAIVVGIPISVVVVPAALIWAAAVRLLARHGWAR